MSVDVATSTVVAQAFDMLEKAEVSSFGDESEEATKARDRYPLARDMVLETYEWSIARCVARLTEKVQPDAVADPDLPRRFALPTDCLILRHVYEPVRWRLDGRDIVSDAQDEITIRYTARVDRERELPATLQTAVAAQLAVLLSGRYVGSRTKQAELKNDLTTTLQMARMQDAVSGTAARFDEAVPGGDWAGEARR